MSFWLFGFVIAWGKGNSFVGWKDNWATAYVSDDEMPMAFLQLTFANTASTIVSGSVAERLNLTSYFVYGVFLTGIHFVKIAIK